MTAFYSLLCRCTYSSFALTHRRGASRVLLRRATGAWPFFLGWLS